MREVARSSGHESGFVLSPPAGASSDFLFRLIDHSAEPVRIRQGRAMGRPSAIEVTLGPAECWVGGPVEYDD